MRGASIDAARAAKSKLEETLKGNPLIIGIGIFRVDGGWGIKVNLSQEGEDQIIPERVGAVPVRVEVVGRIAKRSSA